MDDLSRFDPVIDLFLAGRMPRMNHTRHVALANVLRHLPHGRELMHLGLQVTATRAGVPEKYSRKVTDNYWEQLEGSLPSLDEFVDVLAGASTSAAVESLPDARCHVGRPSRAAHGRLQEPD